MSGHGERAVKLTADQVNKELEVEEECLLKLRKVVEQQLRVLQVVKFSQSKF